MTAIIKYNEKLTKIIDSNMFPLWTLLMKNQTAGGYIDEWLHSIPENMLYEVIQKYCEKESTAEEEKLIAEDFFMCTMFICLFEKGTLDQTVEDKKLTETDRKLKIRFIVEGFKRSGIIKTEANQKTWDIGKGTIKLDLKAKINFDLLDKMAAKENKEDASKI